MTLTPQRTVAGQLATQLRVDVRRGVWRTWLPSERALSQILQASRNSVRAALIQLKVEGIITPVRGFGNRIVIKPKSTRSASDAKTIGVIIPDAIARLRPSIALWIDELKDLFAESGYRLRVYEGQRYYVSNPHRALDRLLGQNPHDAWVLVLSSHAMQSWFVKRGSPCVVAGSLYAGIHLPFFDIDHRAISRHASSVLLRLGHRQIGLLNHESNRAGDIDTRLGFLEGVEAFASRGASARISSHRNDVDSISRALHRLLDHQESPTGIVVSGSYAYVSTSSLLAQLGWRIPQDISLISRDDDPFLQYVVPTPARYVSQPHAFAKNIFAMVHRLTSGHRISRLQTHLLPRFITSGSIAVAPQRNAPGITGPLRAGK